MNMPVYRATERKEISAPELYRVLCCRVKSGDILQADRLLEFESDDQMGNLTGSSNRTIMFQRCLKSKYSRSCYCAGGTEGVEFLCQMKSWARRSDSGSRRVKILWSWTLTRSISKLAGAPQQRLLGLAPVLREGFISGSKYGLP